MRFLVILLFLVLIPPVKGQDYSQTIARQAPYIAPPPLIMPPGYYGYSGYPYYGPIYYNPYPPVVDYSWNYGMGNPHFSRPMEYPTIRASAGASQKYRLREQQAWDHAYPPRSLAHDYWQGR